MYILLAVLMIAINGKERTEMRSLNKSGSAEVQPQLSALSRYQTQPISTPKAVPSAFSPPREAGADSLELPFGADQVELAEGEGRFGRRIFGEVEASQFGAIGIVDDADVGVADLAEVLLAGLELVDGDGEGDLLDAGGNLGEVDLDRFVVARAIAGQVVALVHDGAFGRCLLVVEDEVGIGAHLAGAVEHESGRVEVEVLTVGGARIPAETDVEQSETRSGLGEVDVAAFLQADHVVIPFFLEHRSMMICGQRGFSTAMVCRS